MTNLVNMVGTTTANDFETKVDEFYWELRDDIESMDNVSLMNDIRWCLVTAIHHEIFDRYDTIDLLHRFNTKKREIVRF